MQKHFCVTGDYGRLVLSQSRFPPSRSPQRLILLPAHVLRQMESQQQVTNGRATPVNVKHVYTSSPVTQSLMPEWLFLEGLGTSIPQITTLDFLTFLAPPKPAFDLNGTLEQLSHAGIIVSDRWSAFDIDPTDQPTDENATFSHLVDIFNAVVVAIIANSELPETPIVQLLQNTHKPLESTTIANATKPDGYLALKQRPHEDQVRWDDVVLSCEYKKKLGPITEYNVSIRRGFEMCCTKLPSY